MSRTDDELKKNLAGHPRGAILTARYEKLKQSDPMRARLFAKQREVLSQRTEIKKLNDESVTDFLTGLPNRRGGQRAFDVMQARALRSGVYICVFECDLDKFKSVNDTYGHKAGDQVLQEFARRLTQQVLREDDVLYRDGGEEFVGLLKIDAPQNAQKVVERCRKRIEKDPFKITDSNGAERFIKVTGSFGVTLGKPEIGKLCALSDLKELADAALYGAKNNGRNRVEMDPSSLSFGTLHQAELSAATSQATITHEEVAYILGGASKPVAQGKKAPTAAPHIP